MASAENASNLKSRDGLKVIHVALFRMGTASLCDAYRILGYKVHHGLEDTLGLPWTKIEQAAEATWPDAPGAKQRPRFTRTDWDELWGNEYDIATDIASPFCEQLIEAYPDAKVVIVQRDFETWWPSFRSECLDTLFNFPQPIIIWLCGRILGIRAGDAMRKIHFGFYSAQNREEIELHSRKAYDAYFARIRAMVPLEKRLEYRLGDGWQPLCDFLGKNVPKDVPFPRKNDRKSHADSQVQGRKVIFARSARIIAPWVFGALVLAMSFSYARGSWS